MKNYKEIVNHFETIETVTVAANGKTVIITGYLDDKSFMNGFDSLSCIYDHNEVATEVAEKISYFIGV
jgi:hypothetical protein